MYFLGLRKFNDIVLKKYTLLNENNAHFRDVFSLVNELLSTKQIIVVAIAMNLF